MAIYYERASPRKDPAPRLRLERLKASRAKGTHTKQQWLGILKEFDYRCVCCGCTPVGRPTKDHIVPILDGGSDAIDNLQPLCRECNSDKKADSFNWAEYRRKNGWGER